MISVPYDPDIRVRTYIHTYIYIHIIIIIIIALISPFLQKTESDTECQLIVCKVK